MPPPDNSYSRGYVPHVSQDGLVQMVTFRLHDSLPSSVIDKLRREASGPKTRLRGTVLKRIEEFLDTGVGSCCLVRPEIAEVIRESLMFFDGTRYDLIAWVIMPNHVHVVLRQKNGWTLDKIVHSWKSFTAKRANEILDRTGPFWYREYFDRFIRNDRHLSEVIEYVEENPVRAGLCQSPSDWEFSSAHGRTGN